MDHLKEEHRALAEVIGSDPGMSPRTRKALLDHLLEEEEELAARIAAASPKGAPARSAARRSGLTVGSLRIERSGNPGTPARLGSLRRS
jgi:hypothetical protein